VATVGGIHLLCPAHNQFEAERAYGAEFMRHKREAARNRASEERARGPGSAEMTGWTRSGNTTRLHRGSPVERSNNAR